ncbi:uncharacterized protein ATNIH1004_005725 [Aspergillus tanneri]|uniref:Uncharacterized protein n=1 Tax=Aspergillus tanneri TaxID=1220188 RepID=A0A5M9MJ49_9EURO|nr:uncharacterized protein ATNIH1004_005725 [Aspergillus tanneri]KAA8647042.1 hypothetical protein ATNIH1004_005725 [Aspergillus tanneri]
MSGSPDSPTTHFAEAVKAFLNEADAISMEEFYRRLQPYRIMTCEVTVGGSKISSPILTLENEQSDHRDTGAFDQEDCYMLATSLGSNNGLGSVVSPPRGASAQMHAISELAGSYRLEDISVGQPGTQTYMPDELVIDDEQTGYEVLDLGLWDSGLALGACASALPADLPSPPHLLRLPAECAAPSTVRTDHIANNSIQESHKNGMSSIALPPTTRERISKQQTTKPPVVPPMRFTNYIRDDSFCFIQENLPYWKVNGLWDRSALSDPNWGSSGYESLENIYSCMCELDLRIGHDQIRKRAALKKPQWSKESIGVGRGDASAMIDNILRRMHPDWNLYDALRRSKLRAKFHNEKRYGKRWAVLVAILGPSILFLCTSQLSRTVYVVTSLNIAIAQFSHRHYNQERYHNNSNHSRANRGQSYLDSSVCDDSASIDEPNHPFTSV